MHWKRILIAISAFVLLVSVVAGCGSQASPTDVSSTDDAARENDSAPEGSDPVVAAATDAPEITPTDLPELTVTETPTELVTEIPTPLPVVSPTAVKTVAPLPTVQGFIDFGPCNPIIDVDPVAAFQQEQNSHRDVFWAFHLQIPRSNNDEPPMICFQLYGRDTENETFAPILASNTTEPSVGALFNVCTSHNVQYGEYEVDHSSLKSDQNGGIDVGSATFNGTSSYIKCEMDIGAWAGALVEPNLQTLFTETDEGARLLDEVKEMERHAVQKYRSFTIIAAGQITADEDASNPVAYYLPVSDTCCSPVAMWLPTLNNGSLGTTNALFESMPFEPLSPEESGCSYDRMTENFWWTDVSANTQNQAVVSFAHRPIPSDASNQSIKRCTNLHPNPVIKKMNFSVAPSTLYVGCKPGKDGECIQFLTGTLYGLVFDPTDSKPQFGD